MTDKLIDLSIANDFITDIRFNTALPEHSDNTKLLFPPKDTEKMCEASLTMLDTVDPPKIHTDSVLNLPLEEILLRGEIDKCLEPLTNEEKELLG